MGNESSTSSKTRRLLLEAAAGEVLVNGFRSTSVDQILEKTGVTKGALYYHFKSKKDLGLAMIDEVFRDQVIGGWKSAFSESSDPVAAIIDKLKSMSCNSSEKSVRCGCPLNNLAQEMAAVDEDFRIKVEEMFSDWRTQIADALERGKANETVRVNVDSQKAAIFITSLIEGAVGSAKNARDPKLLTAAFEILQLFIETLRPGCLLKTRSVTI